MGIGSASLGLGFSGESWTGMIGKWEKRKKKGRVGFLPVYLSIGLEGLHAS